MYTVFISKYENDPTPYAITKVLSAFSKKCDYNCVILSPGYMSRNPDTINQYIYNLSGILENTHVGFFYGMNGNNTVNKGTNTIREEHVRNVLHLKNAQYLYIQCINHKDHRKMMFFIKNKSMPIVLEKKNMQCFLDDSTVCGILIGSSNQSLNTYYGGVYGNPANKGEADILMYYEDDKKSISDSILELESNVYNDQINNHHLFPRIRVSKSIDVPQNTNECEFEKEYFKNILKDFLENNLT